jgi:hypothetical protein
MTTDTTRPTRRKLNNGTIDAFTEAISAGLTLERTCDHIGITSSTWRRWRQQGDTDHNNGNTDTLEARLCTAVQGARLKAERRAVLALVRAAVGDEQITERTTTHVRWVRDGYDEAGKRWTYRELTETSTVVERRTVRDWRAALAWLERTQPEHYARVTRQWVSGPEGEPVQLEPVESLRDKLEVELEALAVKLAANDAVDAHSSEVGELGQAEHPEG